MAKTKKELIEEATALGIEVVRGSKIAQLQEQIASHAKVTAEVAPVEQPSAEEEPKVAKAGKRSAKALEEVAEEQAKEERKAAGETAAEAPKAPVVPSR